ncbi:hypothetical protein [Bradyrhizobium sp.]|uniref:hypothetical protein n=1 Tax=Bradyrhizobium sp. TaxID=376 RepID=UPI0027363388|nr:hypothetical protein [Bradyrhizobium sp.]MDP3078655.1 hypothetical protein [Bradyrhizobium sp.]
MRYSIMLAHEISVRLPGGGPDITIKKGGKVVRHKPTMVPVSIEVEAPGLEADHWQILALYKLVKGYRGLSLSGGAARVLDSPLMALKCLERELTEPQPK